MSLGSTIYAVNYMCTCTLFLCYYMWKFGQCILFPFYLDDTQRKPMRLCRLNGVKSARVDGLLGFPWQGKHIMGQWMTLWGVALPLHADAHLSACALDVLQHTFYSRFSCSLFFAVASTLCA